MKEFGATVLICVGVGIIASMIDEDGWGYAAKILGYILLALGVHLAISAARSR